MKTLEWNGMLYFLIYSLFYYYNKHIRALPSRSLLLACVGENLGYDVCDLSLLRKELQEFSLGRNQIQYDGVVHQVVFLVVFILIRLLYAMRGNHDFKKKMHVCMYYVYVVNTIY